MRAEGRPARPTASADRWQGAHAQAAFERLWRDFVNTRILVGLMLLLLQAGLHLAGKPPSPLVPLWCLAYAALTVHERLRPALRRDALPPRKAWRQAIVVDLAAYTGLLWLPSAAISYTPLFALPVLTAAVLGSRARALGMASIVSLIVLGHTALTLDAAQPVTASLVFQNLLSCAGFFFIAMLAHYLADRMLLEQQRTRSSQHAVWQLAQVNALVIDELDDGVMIVDAEGTVRALNPAARRMLAHERHAEELAAPFALGLPQSWRPLAELARRTLENAHGHTRPVRIEAGETQRRLQVRTQLTPETPDGHERLCVMFMQDQHALEARIRTAKMAAMGRMSAAVAHEIRNPLAAILQANELLLEQLSEPTQRQLAGLVAKNTQRLNRMVDDILDVAHVEPASAARQPLLTQAAGSVAGIVEEWRSLHARAVDLTLDLPESACLDIDPEHLRRLLVNLLDNAQRHGTAAPVAIQAWAQRNAGGEIEIAVWSAGPAIDASLQEHLFDPFFSLSLIHI